MRPAAESPQSPARPPRPAVAERARSIVSRIGHAVVLPAGGTERITPHLHHVHADGTATVLLPDEHPLVVTARQSPHGGVAGMLEVADRAPVALREPVRGLLWLTGLLRLLRGDVARRRADAVAAEHADPRLLDTGHGQAVLRLETVSLVLSDGEGTASLCPAAFAAARPDPFATRESHWLRHLECAHPDVVYLLARHLPERVRGGQVRPLGLDRHGLRLRIEADVDHDVRLAFSTPARTTGELATRMRELVGCPFLAAQRR